MAVRKLIQRPPFYTTRQVLAVLDVTHRTFANWCKPPPSHRREPLEVVREGRSVFIDNRRLVQYLEAYRPDLLPVWQEGKKVLEPAFYG